MNIIINVQSPQNGQLEKFADMVKNMENELGVKVLRANLTSYKGVILAHRKSDDSFIVWNSFYHGEHSVRSYDGFSSGEYGLTLEQAITVFKSRTK